MQETFLRAYRQPGRFESRATFGTWVYRIAVNCAIDYMRARPKRESAEDDDVLRAYASAGDKARQTTAEGKRAIIQALHAQNNPEGLAAVARRETDPKLKEEIVRRLSTMTKSKVALDYLMELLNK